MTSVFVSYSRKDWPIAEGLVENLADLGLDMWVDTRIGPRTPFADEIDKALKGADVVIVIWTINSIHSDWVRWEAGEALKAGRLLQLRVKDLGPDQVPAPFCDYNIYADGEPADVKRLVEQVTSPGSPPELTEFANPKPLRPRQLEAQSAVATPTGYVFAVLALATGLALSRVNGPLGSALFAAGFVAGLSLVAYSLYFSVSRFADRFGHLRVMEALIVGVLAGAFAGVVGGYVYAAYERVDSGTGGIIASSFDVFIVKYMRVIVISSVVGMALSYLIAAMLRYVRLRERNLGPVWSRRRIFWNIAIPAALAVLLTIATPILAATLPRIGLFLNTISAGYLSWFGSGRCVSVTLCADATCANCQVGNMSHVDAAMLLGIYLWTVHVYHLRQAGGRLKRMLLSSGVLTLAVLGVMFTFQFSPQKAIEDLEVLSWRALGFAVPWLLLIVIGVAVIYLNARSIEKSEILNPDPT